MPSFFPSGETPTPNSFCREPDRQLPVPHRASPCSTLNSHWKRCFSKLGDLEELAEVAGADSPTGTSLGLWYQQSGWHLSSSSDWLGQDKGYAWSWPGLPAPILECPCSGPLISFYWFIFQCIFNLYRNKIN